MYLIVSRSYIFGKIISKQKFGKKKLSNRRAFMGELTAKMGHFGYFRIRGVSLYPEVEVGSTPSSCRSMGT